MRGYSILENLNLGKQIRKHETSFARIIVVHSRCITGTN